MSADGYVYAAIGKDTGRVKIGHSKDPLRRVKQIESALHERVELLGAVPASRYQEALLHQGLRSAQLKGEWYESAEAVLTQLGYLMQGYEAKERGVLDPRGIA